MFYSPLRYPGGKSKLFPLVKEIIFQNPSVTTYIEPFAGGAGIAMQLLLENDVESIVINDYDKAIYSIWRAILTQGEEFIVRIEEAILNIDEWHRQKEIYLNSSNKYSLDLAFASFYLNRSNRSGILGAGPIGGFDQTGNYLIDARFNKSMLINRIIKIIENKHRIKIYNKESLKFIDQILPKYTDNALVYFDPPYYNKGHELYKNFYSNNDHVLLGNKIANCNLPFWMISYDNVDAIKEIYNDFLQYEFSLNYSLINSSVGKEVLILSNDLQFQLNDELINKFKVNMEDIYGN